ncbi:MAG: hypothetical protein ACJAXQ_000453, partial [Parvibaculaceae bacterium]
HWSFGQNIPIEVKGKHLVRFEALGSGQTRQHLSAILGGAALTLR